MPHAAPSPPSRTRPCRIRSRGHRQPTPPAWEERVRKRIVAATLCVGLAALGLTIVRATSSSAATGPDVRQKNTLAATAGVLFDDFNYTSSTDPTLAAHGWSVRTEPGSPGPEGSAWATRQVTFPTVSGNTVMQLAATTNGKASGTVQSEVSTVAKKFFTGTYAARVYFNDAPASGPDGDAVNQTFFTITPLRYDDDPIYSELDFEDLPNGGWGDNGPTMYVTTWYTYHNEPTWDGDRVTGTRTKSLQGWHNLLIQVASGTVRYFIDGTQVFSSSGRYYPRQPMFIDFNNWFIDLLGSSTPRTYNEQVDWVYHSAGQVLSNAQVQSQVSAYRAANTRFVDSVPANNGS